MAADQTTGGNGERLKDWRQWLEPCSNWQGVHTLFVSPTQEEILIFTFNEILPRLPVTDRRLVDIAFSELKKVWKFACLVEADVDITRKMIRLHLDWNKRRKEFQHFEIQLGTEGTDESRLFWLFHTNQADYEALFDVRYVQIDSVCGETFIGYRIWKLKYPWGEALALVTMKQPGTRVQKKEY